MNYIISNCWWNSSYLARGMQSSDLTYYRNWLNTGGTTSGICSAVYGSQEASTVRVNGGHIAATTENNLCGMSFGYPWTLSLQGSQCKARPDF